MTKEFKTLKEFKTGVLYKMIYKTADKNIDILASVLSVDEYEVEFTDIEVSDGTQPMGMWTADTETLKNYMYGVIELTKEKNPEYYL